MPRWTVDEPTALDFDGVVALKAYLAGGSVSVLATDEERPTLHISKVQGEPLEVSHEAGILTVGYGPPAWDGIRKWVRAMRGRATITVTVPKDCPVQLGVVNADTVISGLTARTSIKSASGDVTLDGVAGRIEVNTVSGALETDGLGGDLSFTTISGDLTVAGGSVERLAVKSVSGRITGDVDIAEDGSLQIGTVSGHVALRIANDTSAQVDLRSVSGRVDVTFPGVDRQEGSRTSAGTLGEGSGRLSVSSISGDITLLGREAR